MPNDRNSRVDIDAHVHVYRSFDVVTLVRHASERARLRGGRSVLALTESHGYSAYSAISGGAVPGVSARPTADPEACVVHVADRAEAIVLSGRQLVSSERIEVLALGLPPGHPLADVRDGARDAESLVTAVLDTGAVCVLPWSVGKWLGRRGREVERIVGRHGRRSRFFLGDIPARTWPWPRPRIFDAHPRVLCGTDPLPLAGAERGVGRYVTVLDGALDEQTPWTSIRALLEAGERTVCAGSRDGFLRGLVDQVCVRAARRG